MDSSSPQGARILVLQNEVPEAVNRAVTAEARGKGATVVLNAAPMRAMAPEMMRLVDLLNRQPHRGGGADCDADSYRQRRARSGGTGRGGRRRGVDHHPGRQWPRPPRPPGDGTPSRSRPSASGFRARRRRHVRGCALCPHGHARFYGGGHRLRTGRRRPVRVDPAPRPGDFVRRRRIGSAVRPQCTEGQRA